MPVGSKAEELGSASPRKPNENVLRLASQAELFPLRAIVEFPNCVVGADVWGRIIADDGNTYIAKGKRGGANVPAAEWVGTHLAEAVDISCARPKVIQTFAGEQLFGSCMIQGVAAQAETALLLTSITQTPSAAAIPGLQTALSEIYTFDMFVNNIDRHDQNFISLRTADTCRIFPIDFARCLFWHNSLDAFPGANQHTVVKGREIRRRHGFDFAAADAMIDRIAAVGQVTVSAILSQMPEEWLAEGTRKEFVDWWLGGRRREKLDALRKGLRDGSLL